MKRMTVVREYTISELALKDQFVTSQESVVASQSLPSNMLLQGATLRTSTSFGRAATVKAGEDIRPALESLRSAGGGTLILLAGTHRPSYDIIGDSKINIVGEGINQTIIDFGGGGYRVAYIGTGGAGRKSNFKLQDLTVTNSAVASAGVYIGFCDNFQINNIAITSCTGNGLELSDVKNFAVDNSRFESNTLSGALVTETTNSSEYFQFRNCYSYNNTLHGFSLSATNISNGTYSGCFATHNDEHGFNFAIGSFIVAVGCQAVYQSTTSKSGFYLNVNATLIGCVSDNNYFGVQLDTPSAKIIGCILQHNDVDIDTTGAGGGYPDTVIIGTEFGENVASSIGVDDIVMTDKGIFADHNPNQSLITRTKRVRMTNTSGAQIAVGSVVVIKAAASGSEMARTTIVGDDLVLGMVEQTSNDTGVAYVLMEGKTSLLKVNGTTDIAIGDFLCTYSVAGIAAKAAAGDMAFAIALEAYTGNDSSGVIDALIISPRKL